MSPPAELRWEGPKMRRAKRIAAEDWAAYESTIRALYGSSTLSELMEAMKHEHGFNPSYVAASLIPVLLFTA